MEGRGGVDKHGNRTPRRNIWRAWQQQPSCRRNDIMDDLYRLFSTTTLPLRINA